jgi:hypothetical protein
MVAIQILGISESQKTTQLRANVEEALRRLQWEFSLEEVGEIDLLMQYDIIGIPALVVDDHILFQKEVPEVDTIVTALSNVDEQNTSSQSSAL